MSSTSPERPSARVSEPATAVAPGAVEIGPDHVKELADHLVARDAPSALALALRLQDEGAPVGRILTELVGPAQEEVGKRWQRNEITVADEHAATAVADQVAATVTVIRRPDVSGPRVVLACAEGEWHVLPARLLAEALRAEGLDVSFLGPSMPARQLKAFLRADPPDVLAVSCSTALTLDGVVAFVHVAHDLGVPVLVGGRAIPSERTARVLGADLWAPDAAGAARLLRQPLPAVLADPTADTGGALALGIDRAEWVEDAMAGLAAAYPALARYGPDQLDRTREDLGDIISFIQAATLARDHALFHDFVAWLRELLEARGVPPVALSLSLRALRDARADDGVVVDLLDEAMGAVSLA